MIMENNTENYESTCLSFMKSDDVLTYTEYGMFCGPDCTCIIIEGPNTFSGT